MSCLVVDDFFFKVLISFTQYRETSPKRCRGKEIQADAAETGQQISAEKQKREKTWLAQEEIERFEEK